MLRALSYANIVFAVMYFLLYLLNSLSYAIAGVLLTLLFNFITIIILDRGLKFPMLFYALGLLCVVFAGFLIVWVSAIVKSSMAYNYFSNSWLYILIGGLFALSIVAQFLLICLKRNH